MPGQLFRRAGALQLVITNGFIMIRLDNQRISAAVLTDRVVL
jgi:hypothetical protein